MAFTPLLFVVSIDFRSVANILSPQAPHKSIRRPLEAFISQPVFVGYFRYIPRFAWHEGKVWLEWMPIMIPMLFKKFTFSGPRRSSGGVYHALHVLYDIWPISGALSPIGYQSFWSSKHRSEKLLDTAVCSRAVYSGNGGFGLGLVLFVWIWYYFWNGIFSPSINIS